MAPRDTRLDCRVVRFPLSLGCTWGIGSSMNERKGKGCDSLIRLEGAAQTISTSGEVFHFQ